ncbi:MAG: sugar kinase [Rhizobiaceae bacterium]
MSGVAAIGECMMEFSKTSSDSWRAAYSGDTFNTLWTMRAILEPSTAMDYVTACGDDIYSAEQVSFFRRNGIGIAASPTVKGAHPGIYLIQLVDGERSFAYWRSDAAARRLADDPAALSTSLTGRTLIYLSGITLAILSPGPRENLFQALATARKAGTRIAFDTNFRPKLWHSITEAREVMGAMMPLVDIALPTYDDEQLLFDDVDPETTLRRLRNSGIGELVIKHGPKGAFAAIDGQEPRYVPAYPVEPLDTTGAGDAFNGAYLAARLSGSSVTHAVARGHLVAACVVRTRGALAPLDRIAAAFRS